MKKIILDVACGGKMFWFDKSNPNVLFLDNRKESHILCDGRKYVVNPDKIMDFRNQLRKEILAKLEGGKNG